MENVTGATVGATYGHTQEKPHNLRGSGLDLVLNRRQSASTVSCNHLWDSKGFRKAPSLGALREAIDDKIACVTVIPGYDDTAPPERKPPRPTTDRRDCETYRILWQAAIAADPDSVPITSWNEWHEGSEIEPSREFGDLALRETALYSAQFLGLADLTRPSADST